jgi:hypothetical protein
MNFFILTFNPFLPTSRHISQICFKKLFSKAASGCMALFIRVPFKSDKCIDQQEEGSCAHYLQNSLTNLKGSGAKHLRPFFIQFSIEGKV